MSDIVPLPPPPPLVQAEQSLHKKRKRQSKCEACRQHKVACDGNNPCHRCSQLHVSCVYAHTVRRRRLAPSPTRALALSGNARCFHLLVDNLTSLFHRALHSGHNDPVRTVKFLAAAKVREQVTGVDYTRGCSDHMLRIGGRELEEEVMRETARVSPLPDREEGELGHLDELWRSMDDSTSSMVFYTFRRGRFSFTCNDKFRRTFALERDIEDGYQQASIMPSLYFAKFICEEDMGEYASLMAASFFLVDERLGTENSSILKCVDVDGQRFLAVVRMTMTFLERGTLGGWLLSILPIPGLSDNTQPLPVLPSEERAIPNIPARDE